MPKISIEQLTINTIRTLSMDGVQKANSGHPGTPMALAPMAYVLWTRFLRFNPKNPVWFNRDRFVLSNGHASMLQYAMLHLTGYDLSLDELKKFRQWDSLTPGHPEVHHTPGVETTTGPLGQGFANAVGMAMAEAHLAARFNRPDHDIIDHFTYAFCGDGDLMEGVSHEAASLAGHLGLGKLICLYDDNHITIEGETELAYSDDAAARFTAYGWHVLDIGERANDLDAIAGAITSAKQETGKPSLIIVRSHIGWGAPNLQDTPTAHGAPLGEEEIRLTKRFYGWPEDKSFFVPDEVAAHLSRFAERGAGLEKAWNEKMAAYRSAHPGPAAQLEGALKGELPGGWDQDLPVFSEGSMATRNVSGTVLNVLAEKVESLIGGSADLAPSTKTLIKSSPYMARGEYGGRNIAWGVREFGMCACLSGMALHGGLRPFGSTFFVFTDYARPAIRLAALMKLPVIYVMTHDSIGVGEDGPTHQPVEHLASLRVIPDLCLLRPADANETSAAWRTALLRSDGPTMLVLTRQGLPVLDACRQHAFEGVPRGGYVLVGEQGSQPQLILIASGSEVSLAVAALDKLKAEGVDGRVVSLPSWELFRAQPRSYRNQVLPPQVKARLAVEAGSSFGWREWIGDSGEMISMDRFGSSAPAKEVYSHFGFTVENIVERAKSLLAS